MRYSSILLTTTVALAISGALTGCRLGNRLEKITTPDDLSGYYEVTPKTLQFCASTSTVSRCEEVGVEELPAILQVMMTDPVHLKRLSIATSDYTGDLEFRNTLTGNDAIAIGGVYDKTGAIGVGASVTPEWTIHETSTTSCKGAHRLTVLGTFSRYASPKPIAEGRTASGRLNVTIEGSIRPTGLCQQTLPYFSACYSDADACEGSTAEENQALQAFVRSIFERWVDAGAISAQDIADLTELAYIAQYE